MHNMHKGRSGAPSAFRVPHAMSPIMRDNVKRARASGETT